MNDYSFSFPSWFAALCANSHSHPFSSKSFIDKLSRSSLNQEMLSDLIKIFGRLNQRPLRSLLGRISATYSETYKNLLGEREQKFSHLLKQTLNDLINRQSLNLEALNTIYPLTIMSSDDLTQCAIREMAQYLLSLPMPFHEARAQRFYEEAKIQRSSSVGIIQETKTQTSYIEIIQKAITHDQEALEKIIHSLFELTSQPKPEKEIQKFTLELHEERILFKHAALKGFGHMISWGDLLHRWSRIYAPSISRQIGIRPYFYKLLVREEKGEALPLKFISFREYLIEQTLSLLFQYCHSSHETLLSGLENEMGKGLKALFFHSERTRQDVMYFIDYLHSHFHRQREQKDRFLFDEALRILNSLISDQGSEIYSFLHATLHFFHSMYYFSVNSSEARVFLFKAIFAVKFEERKFYNQELPEMFCKPLSLDESLLQFAKEKEMPLEEWGNIFLKFSRSININKASTSLSLQEHLKFLKNIEQQFGIFLPTSVIADCLFFQSINRGHLTTIGKAMVFRKVLVKNYLNTLGISYRPLYLYWEQMKTKFDGSFLNGWSKLPHVIASRYSYYSVTMGRLTKCLQFSIYPHQLLAPMSHLMPDINDRQEFIIPCHINRLECIMSDVPPGPARFCRWILNKDTGDYYFSISLFKSLRNPQECCTFQVPLDIAGIPEGSLHSFLCLLRAFVDDLGKEALSGNEEDEMKSKSSKGYYMPVSILKNASVSQEPLGEKLIKFLEHAPLLDAIWQEHQSNFENPAEVAAKLYQFIEELRINFRKAMYWILNSEEVRGLLELDASLVKSFWLYSAKEQKEEQVSFLETLYDETGELTIDGDSIHKFSLMDDQYSITFKINQKISEEKLCYEVEMKTEINKNKHQLSIQYDGFQGSKSFAYLMLWQAHLLINSANLCSELEDSWIMPNSASEG